VGVDYEVLRSDISSGTAEIVVLPLRSRDIERIGWSGTATHLDTVRRELRRVESGEVEYVALWANGNPVSKGGVDFAKEPGAGTVWQLATHPRLEGLGLATRLIAELERRTVRRGIHTARLSVELDNVRARRLYEHLGYVPVRESPASWEAEAPDGRLVLYTTTVTEMVRAI